MIPLGWQEISWGWLPGLSMLLPWALLPFAWTALLRASGMVKGGGDPSAGRFVSARMQRLLANTEGLADATRRRSLALLWLCGMAIIVAIARPQWGATEELVERRGLELVIAVDLSGSMRAQDLPPSRLENARRELAFLVERLEGHKVGLVGFAGTAFMFCPLTLDTDAVELFLDEMRIESIPVPGTAVGEALRVALGAFENEESGAPPVGRVILLMTDGEDHEGDPLKVAQEAGQQGVVIDTVGIGTEAGSTLTDEHGRTLRDRSGQTVVSKLDTELLERLAENTGGRSFRLDGEDSSFDRYPELLERRETRLLGSSQQIARQERFPLFLGLAALLLLLSFIVDEREKRR